MNRKGFTLIELLAVIVILAIIALIATPLILSVIEKSKEGAFKNSVYGVMKAAEYSSLEYQLKNPITKEIEFTFQDGEVSNIDDLKIDYNGKAPTDGVITIGVDGKVSVALTDGKYCAIKNFDENELSITQVNNASECKLILPILTKGTHSLPSGIFLGGPITKGSIESIVFSSTNTVPSNVLGSWDVSDAEDGSVMAWYVDSDNNDLYEVTIGGNGKVYANPNSSHLFMSLNKLKTIDFSHFDTSKVTSMNSMFTYNSSLVSLDLSGFDTSKVTDMDGMFWGLAGLTSLNISNFDTSKVTEMSNMFSYASSLTSLDLSNFDTSNVKNMTNMFYYASGLTSLDLSSFDTSNVTNMSQMFIMASSLTNLNLSNFNTSKVTDMSGMFLGASSLEFLDFRNATFDNVTNTTSMFHGVDNGVTIHTKNETTKTWLEDRLSDSYITGSVQIMQ